MLQDPKQSVVEEDELQPLNEQHKSIRRSSSSSKSKEDDKKEKVPSVPYRKLYRYATGLDWLLIIIGALAACAHGAALPAMYLFFGEITTQFTVYGKYQLCKLNYNTCFSMNRTNISESAWNATVLPQIEGFGQSTLRVVHSFVFLACGVLVVGSIQVAAFSLAAVRQTKKIQTEYFRAILRQDMGFHDVTSSGELSARLSADVKTIRDGLADKVSLVIQNLGMTATGVILALIYSWKLALVTLTVAPLIVISSGMMIKLTNAYYKKETAAYANAGSIAEETISAIRTVVAFGCQHREIDRYSNNLGHAKTVGIKKSLVGGFNSGFLFFAMFSMYGLAFWYGTTEVLKGNIKIGAMITTYSNILIAAVGVGTAGSYMGFFAAATAAAAKIFDVIDRIPTIDIFSTGGDEPNAKSGEIKFEDVHFSYPSRPDEKILDGLSLDIEHGKTVAFVGQSGCGKSTTIQLIQRFYDVNSGTVYIGGQEMKSLNVKKLRDLIGVVAQEPVLFATTIAENIRWGREDVTDAEIEEAARQANAFNFISKLPEKFDTLVGEGGGQLSGGQKQRIAIARAIVRDPKILLLDEATSALDTESESIVQAALEKAAAGRTTIVIAHRLSTVRNADKIVAFKDGKVAEEGTHETLLNLPDGVYANLVNMQAGREIDEEDDEKPDAEETKFPITDDDDKLERNESMKQEVTRRSSTSSSPPLTKKDSQMEEDNLIPKVSTGQSSKSVPNGEKVKSSSSDEEEEKEDLPEIPFSRILALNKPEWHYMLVGCFFAVISGSVHCLNAIFFAEVLKIFTLENKDQQNYLAMVYGLAFIALGIGTLLSNTLEGLLFGKSGMELTVRLRRKAFRAILRQDIAYFDDHRNSTGALCTRLASDASRVQGCTGVRLGTLLKNFFSLGTALGIAFAYGWKLTLLIIAFIPFMVVGGFLEMQLMMGSEAAENEAYSAAGNVAVEAISNIRTVASLTKEQKIFERYVEHLKAPYKKSLSKSFIAGIGYGYSQCVLYFTYAAAFRFGVELIITQEMSFDNVFKVLTAVIFGAMAVGQNSSFAPDYAEAKMSASRMFALFEKVPTIDAYSDEGHKPAHCKGDITIKSAFFHYPTRPGLPILRGCDLTVNAGQTLALVGQSGCGKSTTIQLLERFYDPTSGQVFLDGTDITELNVSWLRYQMGLVSQEPVLFNQSVKENILYGDCSRRAADEEVVTAARNANIHDFVESLSEKYDTNVGAKGGQLSGGQKQRVAIARALLRNPKILLLDEATSALDSESEKIVQEALDAARSGRTSIVIAHRLTTVRNADKIAVIDNGVVVEQGTHDELIALKGAYFSLVNAQLSSKQREDTDVTE